jgi:hypothetical protein
MKKQFGLLFAGIVLAASCASCTAFYGISTPPSGSPVLVTSCTTYGGSTWGCKVLECARKEQTLKCRELTIEETDQ